MHVETLELVGESVRYRCGDVTLWELPLSAIRVIGEMTNQNGPYFDDYFYCFATDPNRWYEASFYAEGRVRFLESLEDRWGCKFVMRLFGSTDFESNVLWPPQLSSKPMFEFAPVEPTTWIGRLFGSWRNTQTFSEEVLAMLRDKS